MCPSGNTVRIPSGGMSPGFTGIAVDGQGPGALAPAGVVQAGVRTGTERGQREERSQPEDAPDGAEHLVEERPAGHDLDPAGQGLGDGLPVLLAQTRRDDRGWRSPHGRAAGHGPTG